MEADRVASPLELAIPGFAVAELHFLVPIDLPSGGFLQVVVGENPIAQAIPSSQIPRGAMVAIISPEAAAILRPRINAALEYIKETNGNGSGPGRAL